MIDVAIVGYGPVGQTLATLLGRRGWRVTAFDRQPGLFPLPRACHLDHEAMRVLQSMGIAEEVEETIVPAREYRLLRADGSILSSLPRDWATPSGWESSYHFFQPDVEEIFDRAARTTPGVEVRQSTSVDAVVDLGDSVRLTAVAEGRPAEEIHARFVVGADGANSLVRQEFGIGQEDLGFEATWVVVDVEVNEGLPLPAIPDTAQVLDPAQPRHMAWLGGRHFRWEFMVLEGDADAAAQTEHIWPKIAEWVSPETATMLRSASYTFRSLVATTFSRGRAALAGDAAHLMPPFMGQGMVSGMRDAATLDWMLDLVLRGAAPLAFLDNYTLSRRAHVTSYIAESVRVGQLVCETDPVKAATRDAELAAAESGPPPFQPTVGGFYVPDPLGGQLSVQPVLRGGHARRLGDVVGAHFAVVTTDADDLSGLAGSVRRALADFRARAVLIRPEGASSQVSGVLGVLELEETGSRMVDWLHGVGASWVIVRPDAYVYASGSGHEQLASAIIALRDRITSSSG